MEPGDKLLLSPPSSPEICLENTKQNTPEMERKNMLNKLKDMKEKGKEFMARIKATDLDDTRTVVDGSVSKNKPEKSMFFTVEEIRGKCGSHFK